MLKLVMFLYGVKIKCLFIHVLKNQFHILLPSFHPLERINRSTQTFLFSNIYEKQKLCMRMILTRIRTKYVHT